MAMLASTDKASNVFYCTNCKEKKPDPVTLACYHTVCQKCLEVHQSFSVDKHIYCPVCETNTQCSDETDSLRSLLNTCTDSASRTLEDLLFKPEGEHCSVCCLHNQRNDVTHQCVDCGDVLCSVCQAGHQASSATYSHRVVAIGDVKTGKYVVEAKKRSFPCGDPNHMGRACAYFCKSCVIPICEFCFLFQHKVHEILALDEAAHNYATKLEERSQQLSTYVTESATPKLEMFRNLERDISSIQEAALKSIRSKTQTAVDLILKQEQEAVKKLSKLCDRQLKLTSTLNTDLEQMSNLCPKLLSLTNLVLRSEQDVAVLILHNDLEKCFKESKQLQDATDVFASKLKVPVFDVRCDVPPESVISITHSFQNVVVGDEDIKKDETIPCDESDSSVSSTYPGSTVKSGDGLSRKEAEVMKAVSSSTSLRPKTLIAKSNPHLSDTVSKCLAGETVSGIPFAIVAPRVKFEPSKTGFIITDVLCSNENLFTEGSAVDGTASVYMRNDSDTCQQEDYSGFKLTESLMIVGEAGKALLSRCGSSGHPSEGPLNDMNSRLVDSTKVFAQKAIRQEVTSDSLMTEPMDRVGSDSPMISRKMNGDSSDSLITSGPMTEDSFRYGPVGLDSSASVQTFDDKQKAHRNVVTNASGPGNSDTTGMTPAEPENIETQDKMSAGPGNSGTPDKKSAGPGNSGTSDKMSAGPVNSGTPDKMSADPGNSGSRDKMSAGPGNSDTTGMTPAEPGNIETQDKMSAGPGNSGTPDKISAGPGNSGTPDKMLAGPGNSGTPDRISAVPGNSGTPDKMSAGPGNSWTPDMMSAGPGNSGTPDMMSAGPGNSWTPDMMSAGPGNSGTPDTMSAGPGNSWTPDKMSAGPGNSDTTGMTPAEPGNIETPDMMSAGPGNSWTPDKMSAGPGNSETPDMMSVGPGNSETPDMMSAGPGNSWTPDKMSAGPGNSGAPDMMSAGPGNSLTPDNMSAGPGNSDTTGMTPAEPGNIETPDKMSAGPGNSGTPDMMSAGPGNSGSPETITAVPGNSGTPDKMSAGPGNNGTIDMTQTETGNIETQDKMSAGPGNSQTPDMLSAGPGNSETPDMIPAEPGNSQAPYMILAGPGNSQIQDTMSAGQGNNHTRYMIPAGPGDSQTPYMIPAGPGNRQTQHTTREGNPLRCRMC